MSTGGRDQTTNQYNEIIMSLLDLTNHLLVEIAIFSLNSTNVDSVTVWYKINVYLRNLFNPNKVSGNRVWQIYTRLNYPFIPARLKCKRWDKYYAYRKNIIHNRLIQSLTDYSDDRKISLFIRNQTNALDHSDPNNPKSVDLNHQLQDRDKLGHKMEHIKYKDIYNCEISSLINKNASWKNGIECNLCHKSIDCYNYITHSNCSFGNNGSSKMNNDNNGIKDDEMNKKVMTDNVDIAKSSFKFDNKNNEIKNDNVKNNENVTNRYTYTYETTRGDKIACFYCRICNELVCLNCTQKRNATRWDVFHDQLKQARAEMQSNQENQVSESKTKIQIDQNVNDTSHRHDQVATDNNVVAIVAADETKAPKDDNTIINDDYDYNYDDEPKDAHWTEGLSPQEIVDRSLAKLRLSLPPPETEQEKKQAFIVENCDHFLQSINKLHKSKNENENENPNENKDNYEALEAENVTNGENSKKVDEFAIEDMFSDDIDPKTGLPVNSNYQFYCPLVTIGGQWASVDEKTYFCQTCKNNVHVVKTLDELQEKVNQGKCITYVYHRGSTLQPQYGRTTGCVTM